MPAHNPTQYMRAYRAAQREARDILEVDCEVCGKTFRPARSDARYCSDACRAAARRARVTLTDWIHNPHGYTVAQGGPGQRRPAYCQGENISAGQVCRGLAVWCRQRFDHPTPHLVTSEFLCDAHHRQAVAAEHRAAIEAFTAHKQQTEPSWLEGKRAGRWGKAATAEAITWWRRQQHIVEVRGELISP
jgi:hypothetical protein